MSSARKCPACGGSIPPDAPEGGCPRCMFGAAASGVAEPAPTAADVEASLPGFEVISVLGQGGMGVVFKARQKALDRIVALKVLPRGAAATPGFAERFAREAKALARLQHPNIVAVHDSGESSGLFWLVMEFVDGANLRQAMRAGQFAPKDALAVVPQICDALQYAHEHGVVHRDIKPENVLLDKTGRVKVADFGLAKLMEQDGADRTLTAAGQVMGTPHYMAPEQVEHPADVDHRADIYSLGVVFYEMLTGELPLGRFPAPSVKAGIDARIDEIVMRTLAKEREARYQQAAQVKTDMGKAATATRRKTVVEPKRWREFLPLSPADQARQDRVREAIVGAYLFLLGVNGWLSLRRPMELLLLPAVGVALIGVAALWKLRASSSDDEAAAAWRRRRRTLYWSAAAGIVSAVACTFASSNGFQLRLQSAGLAFWGCVAVLGLARRWNMAVLIGGLVLVGILESIAINMVRPDLPLQSAASAALLPRDAFRAEDDNGFAVDLPGDQRERIDALWRAAQRLPASPTLDDFADLYSAQTLTKLRAMSSEERVRQTSEGKGGVPLISVETLGRPLAEFRLETVKFLGLPAHTGGTDKAVGVAVADGVRIRFFFDRWIELDAARGTTRPGPWFFDTWAVVDK